MINERRQKEGYGFGWDLVHIGQGLIGLSMLWDLLAHTINSITQVTARAAVLPVFGWLDEVVIRPGLCEVLLPPAVCGVIKVCIALGLATYFVFKLICWTEWVQEEISWEECWEEIKWYNPWSWVTTLVCVVKTVIRWVFQKICKYIGYLVVVLVIICIVVGLLA